MGRKDWYRKVTWTEADQMDFWARLKRSRGSFHKAQYLRIQANYLSKDYSEEALELLDKILKEFPEPSELASAELQRGEILLRQGKVEAGIDAIERAFVHQDAYPNLITQAWAVYGLTIITCRLTGLYDAAEKRALEYESHAAFPLDRFRIHAILAVISQHRGDFKDAIEHARAALAESGIRRSGFRYHAEAGLVKNPDDKLVAELEHIALL